MTWADLGDFDEMYRYLQRRNLTEGQLRVFAVQCVRHIEHHLLDERSQHALNLAEQYAPGWPCTSELREAFTRANEVPLQVVDESDEPTHPSAYEAAHAALWLVVGCADGDDAIYVAAHSVYYAARAGGASETQFQANLLEDVIAKGPFQVTDPTDPSSSSS